MPNSFLQQELQVIYVSQTQCGKAEISVHTPYVDPPGIYAVWRSNRYGRDEAFRCTPQDLEFYILRRWPQDYGIALRSNVIVPWQQL